MRVPALFDELWALVLERTGDAAAARSITHRLVAEALAVGQAAAEPVAARIALPR